MLERLVTVAAQIFVLTLTLRHVGFNSEQTLVLALGITVAIGFHYSGHKHIHKGGHD